MRFGVFCGVKDESRLAGIACVEANREGSELSEQRLLSEKMTSF